MDLNQVVSQLSQNITPVNVIMAVLLIATTVISETATIKGNSLFGAVFGALKAMFLTIYDQLWPKKVSTDTTQEAPKQ